MRIYTLGQFQIQCSSKQLPCTAGQSQRTWELFLFLLSNRGRQLSWEIILDTLWPEADYINPKATLRMQVHRVRNLIAKEMPGGETCLQLISSNGCYRLDAGPGCWVDVEKFEKLTREAFQASRNEMPEAIDMYREAVRLYQGDYLPNISSNRWLLPFRNYFRNLYIKNVLQLIGLLKDRHMYPEIIELCEQVFLVESLEEDIHLHYIEALLEKGKTSKARLHYENTTALLYSEAGVKPSAAMKEVYRQIKSDSEMIELDLGYIQESLKERQEINEAYFCQPEIFRQFYKLHLRWMEREFQPACIGLVSLTGPDFRLPPAASLKETMACLKQIIANSLRRGDIVTQWNEAQFIFLLPGVSFQGGEKVLRRIESRFQLEQGQGGTLRLWGKIQPLKLLEKQKITLYD